MSAVKRKYTKLSQPKRTEVARRYWLHHDNTPQKLCGEFNISRATLSFIVREQTGRLGR